MHTRPRCLASLRVLCILALLVSSATAAHAGFFAADSAYAGYRIPEHRWSYWNASLDASGSHDADPYGPVGLAHRSGLGAALGTIAAWGYDSDRLQHGWNFRVNASGSRSKQDLADRSPYASFATRSSSRSLGERLSIGGSLRFYPGLVPIGLSIFTANSLDLSQSFSNTKISNLAPGARSENVSGSGHGNRNYYGIVSAGAGMGRVRDATPVFWAQHVEERLRRTGSLTRPLSDETRRKLAALDAVGGDIAAAHQRPDKYFWRELERILREDGALDADALDAYDVFRLLEPLSVGAPVGRLAGFFVGPQISIQSVRTRETREDSYSSTLYLADTVAATSSASFDRTFNDRRDDVAASIGAEIHRPLGPRWQADAFTNASIREAGEYPFLTSAIGVTYIVSDRWFAIAGLSHQASGFGHSRHFDRWAAGLTMEIVYFLEDAWALRLKASEGQEHFPSGLERSGGFSLGVTYVVSGFFEAPGLVGAMRPVTPIP